MRTLIVAALALAFVLVGDGGSAGAYAWHKKHKRHGDNQNQNVTVNVQTGGGGRGGWDRGGGGRGGDWRDAWHRPGGGGGGWGRGPNVGEAIVGGAIGTVIGNWFAPRPAPVVVVPERTMEWCMGRYRSYDPYSRSYLGFDGYRHACP